MNTLTCTRMGMMALLLAGVAAGSASAQNATTDGSNCKTIHASMVEARSTVGCKPEHPFCFLGEVTGNHGLRGTTYFKSDGSGGRPTTSPAFLPYSGLFEYQTARGTLIARETGVTNTSQGTPASGAVTAHQQIIAATGELTGATGYFFVSGFSAAGRVETSVTGELCVP